MQLLLNSCVCRTIKFLTEANMTIRPVKQIRNIYGYVRVSTQEQVRSGVSLRQQQDAISSFVQEKYNREVDEFFIDDGVSGTRPI